MYIEPCIAAVAFATSTEVANLETDLVDMPRTKVRIRLSGGRSFFGKFEMFAYDLIR